MSFVRLLRPFKPLPAIGMEHAIIDHTNMSNATYSLGNDLISDGELPDDEYGPAQMFNVPNPPSDVAEQVTKDEVFAAIDRHSETSKTQFLSLPTEIQERVRQRALA